MMATKRREGVKGVRSVTRAEAQDLSPFIRAHNTFQELCFRGAAAGYGGTACFLLTTVFYIQTNEGTGKKIMRDGMREREELER